MTRQAVRPSWRRVALALGAVPLLASCWWLEADPEPGEWRLRSGTIGDFQPRHVATLFEADGSSQLLMECGQGPIAVSIGSEHGSFGEDAMRLPVRYRLDGQPLATLETVWSGQYLWFSDPQAARTGDDPMVARIAGARQLTLRIDWSQNDRQILRFDTSRAGAAIEWLRGKCAESRARRS